MVAFPTIRFPQRLRRSSTIRNVLSRIGMTFSMVGDLENRYSIKPTLVLNTLYKMFYLYRNRSGVCNFGSSVDAFEPVGGLNVPKP